MFGGAFEQVKAGALPNNGQFESLLRQQLMLQQQQRLAMVLAMGSGGAQFGSNGGQMPFMFGQPNIGGRSIVQQTSLQTNLMYSTALRSTNGVTITGKIATHEYKSSATSICIDD
jgi:hypothetical protein